MNSDLISKQALIESITRQYDLQYRGYSFKEMIDCVKKQPVLYDVGSVIEQLKDCCDDVITGIDSNYCPSICTHDNCVVCIFDKVFEIVRNGGINE